MIVTGSKELLMTVDNCDWQLVTVTGNKELLMAVGNCDW